MQFEINFRIGEHKAKWVKIYSLELMSRGESPEEHKAEWVNIFIRIKISRDELPGENKAE